jgi:hypothetical protein
MPYCPQCLIEYVEGTAQCEDCGSFLLPGSPPEAAPRLEITNEKDVKLVSVRTFTGGTAQMEAELARNILQSQGIPCVQSGEGAANLLPVLDVHLLVREEDVERAAVVLDEYLDTNTAANTEGDDPTEGG